jgi:uncharacterized protein YeaO (DUF488 family)
MIQIKRAYEEPSRNDGVRLLVDRIWPRGVAKEEIRIDAWRRDLAPSTALRNEFKHDPARWNDFLKAYRAELLAGVGWDALKELAAEAKSKRITLVYGAKDETHNQAAALKQFIESMK